MSTRIHLHAHSCAVAESFSHLFHLADQLIWVCWGKNPRHCRCQITLWLPSCSCCSDSNEPHQHEISPHLFAKEHGGEEGEIGERKTRTVQNYNQWINKLFCRYLSTPMPLSCLLWRIEVMYLCSISAFLCHSSSCWNLHAKSIMRNRGMKSWLRGWWSGSYLDWNTNTNCILKTIPAQCSQCERDMRQRL